LRLRLAAAGIRAVLFDYDWRQDLLATARTLAARLEADSAARIILVGHSMGGLLARAALPLCSAATGARVQQLIGLGTPHGGSMAAVQALRATYPVVLRLAAMDQRHDARTLTMEAFRYFHSLYQMLPADHTGLDFHRLSTWPATGAVPDERLLKLAQTFQQQLAPADARFVSIIGTGQRTVTAVARGDDEFRYEVSSAGDGTVPIRRATLPDARIFSLRCEHSELPRSPRVAAAIVDLVRTGGTRRLSSGVTEQQGKVVRLSDSTIRQELDRKIDWHHLSVVERRRYLDHLSDPPLSYRPAARKLPVRKL
jgi:pimeloyl-ACP methyl ester carboxylesterase